MSICVATLTSESNLEGLMQDDEMAIEVVVPVEEKEVDSIALGKTLWNEITAGVGIWGAFRPVIAVTLSLIPFLFLGQHFNRNHRRGVDWFLLQIPLAFTIVLWILLYVWSIFDTWRDASVIVAQNQGQS
ncbi:MAG: hypothetical protein CMB55_03580 [Euryarchaeota archaeon]|nr:hypothetical protein [Euryarchaeota archaeon]|tara:strand:+ start:141 stop:530 length:390 start_codon:yes stop_codon:yes gene_type:complete